MFLGVLSIRLCPILMSGISQEYLEIQGLTDYILILKGQGHFVCTNTFLSTNTLIMTKYTTSKYSLSNSMILDRRG